jgi:hypothetical protein
MATAVAAYGSLASEPAHAQTQTALMGCCNMGPAVVASGGGGGGYVGPGDVVSGAKVWLGLRAYSAATADGTHKAVKLVRASDSHSCDALLNTSGNLGNTASCSTGGESGTAVAAWCAATTCAIDVFYDQSGNGFDFTASSRATLVFSCLGSLPCADFGAGVAYYFSSTTDTAQPLTTSAVAIRTGAFTVQNDLFGVGTGTFYAGANALGGYFGNTATATASDNVWHAAQIVTSGASSAVAVDATQTSGLNMGTASTGAPLNLGTQNTGGNRLNGRLTEIGLWPAAFSGAQQANVCHNQFTYWGTPTSC